MKKIVSLLLAVIMLFGTMLALSSCGEPKNAGAEIEVYLGSEIYDFDPTDYYVDKNAEQVMSLLYEPLFKLNEKGELKCAAAKDYKVIKSERQIVINLRESYWSDEQKRVTAADFTYAWRELIINPNKSNPAAALFYDVENAVAIKAGDKSVSEFSAVASDLYEITITYREGADYNQLLKNLASVATAPVRVDVVEKAVTHWSKDLSKLITNGPFKVQSIDHSTYEFTLGRNMGYHQKPTAKKYTKNVTPAALVSFFAPEGVISITYDDIANNTVFYMGDANLEDRIKNKDKAKVTDALSTYSYVFNTDNPLFKIKEVRQALSLAIDRTDIANTVTFGKAAAGLLPDPVSKSIYGKEIQNRIETSAKLDEAKALIANVDFTGISKSFKLTVNADEESIAIAEKVKAAWQALGFTVSIDKASAVEKQNIVDKDGTVTIIDSEIQVLAKDAAKGIRNFDVLAVDWQMYSTDAFVALSAFTSSMNGNGADFTNSQNRKNISGWSSYEYDQYITQAYKAQTEEERNTALQKAEQLIVEECPVIPVLYNQNFAFISSELSGIKTDGFGNFVLTKASQKNYEKYLTKEEN